MNKSSTLCSTSEVWIIEHCWKDALKMGFKQNVVIMLRANTSIPLLTYGDQSICNSTRPLEHYRFDTVKPFTTYTHTYDHACICINLHKAIIIYVTYWLALKLFINFTSISHICAYISSICWYTYIGTYITITTKKKYSTPRPRSTNKNKKLFSVTNYIPTYIHCIALHFRCM